jgi:hypothetical protein
MLGSLLGLAFGSLGLALALGLLTILGGLSLISRFPLSVAVGASTALIVASWLGRQFELRAAQHSPAWAAAFGPFTAVASLELGVLFGSIPELIATNGATSSGHAGAVWDFVVKPVYWVNLVGLLPAVVLGVCFGAVLRSVLSTRSAWNGERRLRDRG